MCSLVDTAINVAMGTLTETHGIPVTVRFAKTNQTVQVRGIFNANAITTTMSGAGIPMESTEVQIGFRKTDFAGYPEPTHGDIVIIPNHGQYTISRRPSDDGIELTCGLKEIPNA